MSLNNVEVMQNVKVIRSKCQCHEINYQSRHIECEDHTIQSQ